MPDNSTIALQGNILLLNQLELVAPTTLGGTLYGTAFTLFCFYAHALVPRLQEEGRRRQAKFMLVYSTVIMLCGLYNLVANTWLVQDAYTKHANYPGGPFSYVATALQTPMIIIGFSLRVVVDILTSANQIWRLWVVFRATRYGKLVMVLPLLCFLTFATLRLKTIILGTTLPMAQFGQLTDNTELAEIAIRGATTILCTTLISLLLVFDSRSRRTLTGKTQKSNGYSEIVAILIESYALESVWLFNLAVVFSRPIRLFFAETMTYIEIITYLLVQYRIASGKAYESQSGQSPSSLHGGYSTHVEKPLKEQSEGGGGIHYL